MELQAAENYWIKVIQLVHFQSDRMSLKGAVFQFPLAPKTLP